MIVLKILMWTLIVYLSIAAYNYLIIRVHTYFNIKDFRVDNENDRKIAFDCMFLPGLDLIVMIWGTITLYKIWWPNININIKELLFPIKK